jgi:hypothetical protein
VVRLAFELVQIGHSSFEGGDVLLLLPQLLIVGLDCGIDAGHELPFECAEREGVVVLV